MTALAIVERWQEAVNAADVHTLARLSADDIAVVGPRGVGRGRDVLAAWLARARFTAEPRRWFCGRGGRVAVEQLARWHDPSGGVVGERVVTATYVVDADRVTRFERFDDLASALTSAGLSEADEVRARHRGRAVDHE